MPTPSPTRRHPSPTVTDQTPVPVANPLSDTLPSDTPNPLSDPAATVEVLFKFGFNLNSGADSWPVDEQTRHLCIDPFRQLAAYFRTPTPDQNKI